MKYVSALFLSLVFCLPTTLHAAEQSLAALEQEAINTAADAVADSVVQIRTIGGLDRVGKTLLSQGPTTGLIVSSDGYIVSSAFNFASQPSSILVRLANGDQLAAELVARDKNRMLVLLKVATDKPLPTPAAVPRAEMQVGQWAIALGRTFQAEQVGVSVGVVSALNRMYGRVIQTDAKVSVANYGGPLVDISGRVLGVLVPMSPQSSGGGASSELAGAEYYDSGIGFAVPLEHINAILQRWQLGEDLLPGKMGVGLASGDAHVTEPKITSVWPNSPAAVAGWKPDDLIIAVNGNPIKTQSHLRFQILPLYAEDKVNVTLRRGDEELQTELELAGEMAAYQHPFLGVLPVREQTDDEQPGAKVRRVWPDSPAAQAGLQAGDLIEKINEQEVKSNAQAHKALSTLHPDETVQLLVMREEQELELSAKLAKLPAEILPLEESVPEQEGGDPDNGVEDIQLEQLKLPQFSQEAVYYQPNTEQDQQSGLLVWLGDGITENNQAIVDYWQTICRRDGLILLIAPPAEESAWKSDDLAYLQQLLRAALQRFKVDRQRLVVAGQGKAGQLAYALTLGRRSALRGVIAIDAPLPRTLKIPAVSSAIRRAILAVESSDSTFAPLIRRDVKQLGEAGYQTSWLQCPQNSDVATKLDAAEIDTLARWIDSLDCY